MKRIEPTPTFSRPYYSARKRLRELLLSWGQLVAIVVSCSQGSINLQAGTYGIFWEGYFSGDRLPSQASPAWTFGGSSGSATGAIVDGVYTHSSTASDFFYWDLTDASWSSLGGRRTLNLRARILTQDASDDAARMTIGIKNRHWSLNFQLGSIQLTGSNTIGTPIPLDTTVFHTYRITIDDTLTSDIIKVYVDGQPDPLLTSGTNPGGFIPNFDLLSFTDRSSGGIGGTSQWEFISWGSGVSVPSAVAEIKVLDRSIIDTVRSSDLNGARAHLNFPDVTRHFDGTLVVTYSVGQTQSGLTSASARQAVSVDEGRTWTQRNPVPGDSSQCQLIRPSGQTSYGFGAYASNPDGFTSWNHNGRYISMDGGNTWSDGSAGVFYDTSGVAYTVMNGLYSDLVESPGTLYMPMFGKRIGASAFENVLMVSSDDGASWIRRSTIAQYTSSLNFGAMGSEGPNETALVKLRNGNLLAVFRTGQPFPNTDVKSISPALFWCISEDEGHTWSSPKTLGVSGVYPLIQKIEGDLLALTYGRYGAHIMLADPTGLRWSTPTTLYNGSTSGHIELKPLGEGRYALVHDQSGFYPPPWNGSVPPGYIYDNDKSANLHALALAIQPPPSPGYSDWALTFNGDTTPDATADGWELRSSGAGMSIRCWAEYGQDFLRFEAGSSSASRTGYYELDSSDPVWAAQDFDEGFILDFRARAGNFQAGAGTAVVRVGKGGAGEASVEFTGSGITLRSSTVTSISLNTRQWVDVRLSMKKDATTGQRRVSVYLDRRYSHPVMQQDLAPGAYDGVSFGDVSSVANGVFEVDYLRFGSLSFEGWRRQHFTSSELNTALSAEVSDPDGDGFPNLIEYALLRDPRTAESAHPLQGSIRRDALDGNDYLVFKYTRRKEAGIAYELQVSEDLVSWQGGVAHVQNWEILDDGNGVTERVVARALQPLLDSRRRFMRLVVTRPRSRY